MESEHLSVVRIWAALAWADGVIAPAEAAAMNRLIDNSPELSDEERGEARQFLQSRVELDVAGLSRMNEGVREGIYRAAVQLSRIDREVAQDEVVFLERLREGLGISKPTARNIELATVVPRK